MSVPSPRGGARKKLILLKGFKDLDTRYAKLCENI